MSVVLFSKIDSEMIKIKKPVSVGLGNYRLNISYNHNNLLIQTPTLYNPFDVSKYDSLDLYINSEEMDNNFLELIKYISKLAEKMADPYDLEYVDSVKFSDYSPDKRLRLNISRNCTVFNKNKQKIDMSDLSGKTMAKYIISPKYIWLNYVSKKFGIFWEVVQVKIMEQNYDIYMFLDDEEEKTQNINSSEKKINKIPDKYNKMIKMGIPQGAIENKMRLDGLDPDLYFSNNNITKNKTTFDIIRPDPLSLINAKANLKKKNQEYLLKETKTIRETGFKPPSIDELNTIRLKLNNINK